jgi:hypothetical protein
MADCQNDCRLGNAQQHLINHMRCDIGSDMGTGAVFPFNNRTLAADDLDGIEAAVPDTDACQCEASVHGSFLGHKHIRSDGKCDKAADQGCHRQYFPVILIDKHADQLAEIDSGLGDPAPVF